MTIGQSRNKAHIQFRMAPQACRGVVATLTKSLPCEALESPERLLLPQALRRSQLAAGAGARAALLPFQRERTANPTSRV